ncbi:sigma-70 family RNA polymerase sigma factor [Microbacterium resistens]|uniref:sigma-70 family RNA polymerase sigma factor n=1 Tax=Microbacterium resistens TaxID=156977 RepID=UPI001C5A378C|nr:sigma-70 family RNA polymerase sigma factor [Microbacterium resistens]MBW1638717.1 sigma-70 family RNA polymerase sigma factor [Microbacterium resistens]
MTASSPATQAWERERGRLLGIAYRMLGDLGHAEDVVSEVAIDALREERAGTREVRSWPALLTTMCVRRSIDRLRAEIAVREDYVGHWLPEPVATGRLPEDAIADRELLSHALLHLAEQLAPEARAALVLHRAFGMPTREIAEILEKSPTAVRQLLSRAERRLRIDATSTPPRSADREALARLVAAIEEGEIDAVVTLLEDDAILWADGGGRVRSALNPVFGAEKVARFLRGIVERARAHDAVHPLRGGLVEVNGETALLLHYSGHDAVVTIELGDSGRIRALRQVANPEKLRHARAA